MYGLRYLSFRKIIYYEKSLAKALSNKNDLVFYRKTLYSPLYSDFLWKIIEYFWGTCTKCVINVIVGNKSAS